MAATLALSATRNNDRVALLLATDRVEWFVPPRKGRRHALRIVRDLLAFRPRGRGTDMAAALDYASRLFHSRTVVFLFSDFLLGEGWAAFGRSLARLAVRHDLVAVRLTDPAEGELPEVGLVRVRDPESGDSAVLRSSGGALRERYAALVREERERAARLFARHRVDEVVLRTDEPYTAPLLAFFRRRERRRAR